MSSNYTWNATHPIYGIPLAVAESPIHPTITCTVRLPHHAHTTTTSVTTWLNTNYFLWAVCAAHAAHLTNINPSNPWTQAFNFHHLATWTEIQARVAEIENPYRFGIPIPEPPVRSAVVTHITDSGPAERFVIRAEPSAQLGVVSGLALHSVWRLFRFVTGRECGGFEVLLYEDEEVEAQGEDSEAFVLIDSDLGDSVGSLPSLVMSGSSEDDSSDEDVRSVEGDVWRAEVWEFLDGLDEDAVEL
jgi:hypothetical protein